MRVGLTRSNEWWPFIQPHQDPFNCDMAVEVHPETAERWARAYLDFCAAQKEMEAFFDNEVP